MGLEAKEMNETFNERYICLFANVAHGIVWLIFRGIKYQSISRVYSLYPRASKSRQINVPG